MGIVRVMPVISSLMMKTSAFCRCMRAVVLATCRRKPPFSVALASSIT
ncbi:hypothetical protein KIF59_17360 [Enterobacter cloacae subsp. cloacae]|nr:hypothetical protein [Enterobacter cloacae subsp. cloacae]